MLHVVYAGASSVVASIRQVNISFSRSLFCINEIAQDCNGVLVAIQPAVKPPQKYIDLTVGRTTLTQLFT